MNTDDKLLELYTVLQEAEDDSISCKLAPMQETFDDIRKELLEADQSVQLRKEFLRGILIRGYLLLFRKSGKIKTNQALCALIGSLTGLGFTEAENRSKINDFRTASTGIEPVFSP